VKRPGVFLGKAIGSGVVIGRDRAITTRRLGAWPGGMVDQDKLLALLRAEQLAP